MVPVNFSTTLVTEETLEDLKKGLEGLEFSEEPTSEAGVNDTKK